MADLPCRRIRRNVKRPTIKPQWHADAGRFGVWIPGNMHPVADIRVTDDGEKLVLEIRQVGLNGRLVIKPEVSNVIKVEMARD